MKPRRRQVYGRLVMVSRNSAFGSRNAIAACLFSGARRGAVNDRYWGKAKWRFLVTSIKAYNLRHDRLSSKARRKSSGIAIG